MLEISNMQLRIDSIGKTNQSELHVLTSQASSALKIPVSQIKEVSIKKKSIDARKKANLKFIYTLQIELIDSQEEDFVIEKANYRPHKKELHIGRAKQVKESFSAPLASKPRKRPVVVGAGCAGLFAALELAHGGLEPILIERGQPAFARQQTIDDFLAGAPLDTESNIQFGVGGAGTFSDGKLATGTKSSLHRLILETFVKSGASPEILYEAKPHIGSDVLPRVVTNICKEIEDLGGQVKTSCKMTDFGFTDSKKISYVEVEDRSGKTEIIDCDNLILATGHSARDVFELLYKKKLSLERKTFAMGVRIEHLQKDINRAQYGDKFFEDPRLGAAPYKSVAHLKNGRSAFSFCMCPGGYVVAATSEENQVVTNGMSYADRAGVNANAGLLSNVCPEDLPGTSPLAGIELQRQCEKKAFELGGGDYKAPAQLTADFLQNTPSSAGSSRIQPTYPKGVTWCNVSSCLPDYIAQALREAIPMMDRKLKGFAVGDGVITGIESRSSSPVRLVRTKEMMSVDIDGLWPAGEGAGYAGGIMSAATDGIRVARSLIDSIGND